MQIPNRPRDPILIFETIHGSRAYGLARAGSDLDKERRYRNAHNEWQQYQGWLKHRNPARAALEARFALRQ
jgi:predicted nucleotidyltransferase